MHKKFTQEELETAVIAWQQNAGSRKKAAEALGLSHAGMQRRLEAAAQQGLIAPAHPVPDGLTLRGTSALYDANGKVRQLWNKTKVQGRSVEDSVQLPDPKKIVKVSTNYDAQGNVAQQWIQEKPEDAQREKQWIDFAKALAADLPQLAPRPAPEDVLDSKLMAFMPWGDPHFGMYSWAAETGNDFDLDIAKRDLCGAVDYLVAGAPNANRLVIASVGDFFHVDNLTSTTPTHGHHLDMDTRIQKVMQVGVAAFRQAIDTGLERFNFVEVIAVPGNHDPITSMALVIMLSHIYENEPRVIIHTEPTLRQYVRHGKVLLGVVHGDRTKDADLPGVMATERAQAWGETNFRRWFRGHHHQDKVQEFNGCTVEQVRTLSPGDAYAVGGGWLSGRDMKIVVYHAEFGEVARATCSIELLRHVQATRCVGG